MMRCIAIDDEKLVLDLMEDNIRQVPFLELVKTCKNALEAADALQKENIDLIFLDIQMPRLTGLQFIQTLPHPPLVILVTAYSQYAIESYNLNVIDYLLKPVSFERFLKACNKAHSFFQLQQKEMLSPQSGADDYFFVNVEYTLVKIIVTDIDYIEGLKDYIKIYLSSSPKPVITRLSLRSMEERLPDNRFIRIHKSYIVAYHKITVIKRDFVCIGAKELPLSDSFKDSLLKLVNQLKK